MDHTSNKSTGYTLIKNYFRLWILAEVELFCQLNCAVVEPQCKLWVEPRPLHTYRRARRWDHGTPTGEERGGGILCDFVSPRAQLVLENMSNVTQFFSMAIRQVRQHHAASCQNHKVENKNENQCKFFPKRTKTMTKALVKVLCSAARTYFLYHFRLYCTRTKRRSGDLYFHLRQSKMGQNVRKFNNSAFVREQGSCTCTLAAPPPTNISLQ